MPGNNEINMSFWSYQYLSSRTANGTTPYSLANWGLGLTGEAGEVADIIKKVIFHGHDADYEALEKELGDVLWYLAQIATSAGLDLETIAQKNIDKLKKRYPTGFSVEASVNRKEDDK